LNTKVDHVDAELPEARLARLGHEVGAAVVAFPAVRQVQVAELGSDGDFVAPPLDRLAEQPLVPSIHATVCGIEKRDAFLDRRTDQRGRSRRKPAPSDRDLEGARAEHAAG